MSERGAAMGGSRTHRYEVACGWSGSTAGGYDAYERTHSATVSPSGSQLTMSSDAAFRGSPELVNPEQLLLLAAVSCQLLSFLAVAARARIDVVAYVDEATALMPEDDPPLRVTEMLLRPRITVRGAVREERILHLVEVAHRECFIANSLRTSISIEATVVVLLSGSDGD